MGKRLNINEVKYFVEIDSNSGCKLQDEVYINNSTILHLVCNCGEPFEKSFTNFKDKNQRQCRKCSGRINWDNDSVKFFIENESKCKLLSHNYKTNKTNLRLECSCGKKFTKTFHDFKDGNQRQCNECGIEKGNYHRSSLEEIAEYIESLGYILLTNKYINSDEKIIIKDKNGYMYSMLLSNLKGEQGTKIVHKSNPFSIDNIKLWCKINQKDFIVLSDKYEAKNIKLKWKCLKDGCKEIFYAYWYDIYNDKECVYCSIPKGEKKIKELFNNNYVSYDWQKEFQGLIGLGGGLLSYDFFLLKYNLLIEYQGEFHDGKARHQTKAKLKKQKEHDRRKKEYALQHKYNFLEIWYWDFDNIETILESKLKELSINDDSFLVAK